jgi:3-dehydroquinate synthase
MSAASADAAIDVRGVKTAPETWISPLTGSMPLHFGDGAVEMLPAFLEELRPDKVFIISDHRVFDIHGAFLLQLLPGRLAPEVIRIPEGESEKSLSSLESICKELFDRGATKSSVVVNFGGGVVLNVGGLSASLCYRGLRFVQVPTTMMAQSDVIVSNKQGVNFAGGKNRLGVFATPKAAFADPRFCATEPPRQLRAALVEYAKNAVLLGGAHFDAALRFFEQGDLFSPAGLRLLLRSSLEQKFEIARLDPTEREFGMVLEYGHTVGHAVEGLSQGRVLHGEAVYHGMNVAGRLANRLGIFPDVEYKRQSLLLSHIRGIPTVPPDISVGQILQAAHRDNKKKDPGLSFILLQAIGRPHRTGPTVLTSVSEEDLRQVLLEYRDALL